MRRRIAPDAHELGNQHRVRLVVAEVVEVGRARVVVESDQVALCVQRAAHLDRKGRRLGVPGRLLVPHPLHADGTSHLLGQVRRLEPRVVGGRASVALGPLHPDHAHAIARHLKEFGDAVPQAVRLHVIGIDRHLIV